VQGILGRQVKLHCRKVVCHLARVCICLTFPLFSPFNSALGMILIITV
jgi:hypothetical protein